MTTASGRASRFWDKLVGYYGSALTDQFGPTPPADWCEVIDGADNDTCLAALADIRQQYVNWPPKFPQFEAIFAKLQRPRSTGPSVQDQLVDFVLKNRELTPFQVRMPWTFLYRGHAGFAGTKASPDYAVTGVMIPADGEYPGHRVMVYDMQLQSVA
jgi:hypothetical protein